MYENLNSRIMSVVSFAKTVIIGFIFLRGIKAAHWLIFKRNKKEDSK